MQVIQMLPKLARFNTGAFVKKYLAESVEYLLKVETKSLLSVSFIR